MSCLLAIIIFILLVTVANWSVPTAMLLTFFLWLFFGEHN